MNKGEIKQEILDLIGEVSPMMIIPPESIEDAIQFAQDEISVKLGLTYVETPGIAVDANGIAILPDALVKPVRVWYDSTPVTPPVTPYSVHPYYMSDLSNPQDPEELLDWGPPTTRYWYQLNTPEIPFPSDLVIVVDDPDGIFSVAVKDEILTGRSVNDYNTIGFIGSAPSGDWFVMDDVDWPPDFISAMSVDQSWHRIVYNTLGGSLYGAGIIVDFTVTITNTITNATYDLPFRIKSEAL